MPDHRPLEGAAGGAGGGACRREVDGDEADNGARRALTEAAATRYARFGEGGIETDEARHQVVEEWARQIVALGAEIKGLWLVDFDSGAGYYCWKYPEPSLGHFHGYEEGFSGRVPLQ